MNRKERPQLLSELSTRLQEPLPAKEALKMMFPNIKAMPETIPDTVRLSAVMALLFLKNDDWYLLAIRRTEDGHAHSGQIGFPGGRYELSDKDMQATALRETFEEIGVSADQITMIGALSPVYVVVSNFNVFPFVGYIEKAENFVLSTDEIQSVIEIRLEDLFAPTAKVLTEVVSPAFPEIRRKVNAYQLPDGTIIWGATAIMIAELELLLQNK